jgi:hypothetical protein
MVYFIIAVKITHVAVTRFVAIIAKYIAHFTGFAKETYSLFVFHFCLTFLATYKVLIYSPLKQFAYFAVFQFAAAAVAIADIINRITQLKSYGRIMQGFNVAFSEPHVNEVHL